jgi:hypothetical protein
MKSKAAATTKRRSMISSINDGGSKYQYFAMKMMTRSYIVENGWEHMVEQERLAMVSKDKKRKRASAIAYMESTVD